MPLTDALAICGTFGSQIPPAIPSAGRLFISPVETSSQLPVPLPFAQETALLNPNPPKGSGRAGDSSDEWGEEAH